MPRLSPVFGDDPAAPPPNGFIGQSADVIILAEHVVGDDRQARGQLRSYCNQLSALQMDDGVGPFETLCEKRSVDRHQP